MILKLLWQTLDLLLSIGVRVNLLYNTVPQTINCCFNEQM